MSKPQVKREKGWRHHVKPLADAPHLVLVHRRKLERFENFATVMISIFILINVVAASIPPFAWLNYINAAVAIVWICVLYKRLTREADPVQEHRFTVVGQAGETEVSFYPSASQRWFGPAADERSWVFPEEKLADELSDRLCDPLTAILVAQEVHAVAGFLPEDSE